MKKYLLTLGLLFVAGIFVYSTFARAEDKGGNDEQEMTASGGMSESASSSSEDNQQSGFGKDFEDHFNNFLDKAKKESDSVAVESLSVGGLASGAGDVRITDGNVDSVSGSTLQVSVWGLQFNVDVSKAQFTSGLLSDVKTGDKVTIKGTVDRTTKLVSAELIFDRSTQSQAIDKLKAQIQALIEQLNAMLKAQGQGQ